MGPSLCNYFMFCSRPVRYYWNEYGSCIYIRSKTNWRMRYKQDVDSHRVMLDCIMRWPEVESVLQTGCIHITARIRYMTVDDTWEIPRLSDYQNVIIETVKTDWSIVTCRVHTRFVVLPILWVS